MKIVTVVILFFSLVFGLTGCRSGSRAEPKGPVIQSKTGAISEADLGVPLYPSARPDNNASFIFQGNAAKGASETKTSSATLSTPDSVDKVERFYREKLGSAAQFTDHVLSSGKRVDVHFKNDGKEILLEISSTASGQGSLIVILTQSR